MIRSVRAYFAAFAFAAASFVAASADAQMFLRQDQGGFYLGAWGEGLARMLHDGEHCAFYRDRDECVRLVEEYLHDAPRRDAIRRQGEAFVRRYHTFDERIRNLLGAYEFTNPLASPS